VTPGRFDAIVMAGGQGKRLMPYTTILPKPLMPLGEAPVLEHLLRELRAHGIRHVCLAVNHLHHLIRAFFGNGGALDLSIEYVVENAPLGTGGPVSQILDRMSDDFLVLNGDLVTDLNLADVMANHKRRQAAATVAVLKRTIQVEYGVLDTDGSGNVKAIREKPVTEHLVSMGVYALHRDSLREFLPEGKKIDMPELLSAMIAAGHAVNAYFAECDWLDIGRPEDYAQALSMVARKTASGASS
jgi:NDP-mannose synthase